MKCELVYNDCINLQKALSEIDHRINEKDELLQSDIKSFGEDSLIVKTNKVMIKQIRQVRDGLYETASKCNCNI